MFSGSFLILHIDIIFKDNFAVIFFRVIFFLANLAKINYSQIKVGSQNVTYSKLNNYHITYYFVRLYHDYFVFFMEFRERSFIYVI